MRDVTTQRNGQRMINNKRGLTQNALRGGLTRTITLNLNKAFILHKNRFSILRLRGKSDTASLTSQKRKWVKADPSMTPHASSNLKVSQISDVLIQN